MFDYSYNFSNGGLNFLAWPDGKSYEEQDNYLIEIFKLIESVVVIVQRTNNA